MGSDRAGRPAPSRSTSARSADDLHRRLTSLVLEGADLVRVADETAGWLGTGVLICRPDGRVQAVGGTEQNRQVVLSLPLFEPSGRLLTEQFRSGLQQIPGAAGGRLAVAAVLAGRTDLGRIVAYFPGADIRPTDVEALDSTAIVAALIITKELAISAVESKFRGDFLRDVLAGSAGTPTQVVEYSRQLGWNVQRDLVVVVVRLDGPNEISAPVGPGLTPLARLTLGWEQVLRDRDPTAPIVGFHHEIIMLVPATAGSAAAVLAELHRTVTGDRGGGRRSFSTGVSRAVSAPEALPAAYEQARQAVVIGRRLLGPGEIAHFDRLGVHRLLSLAPDVAELQAFATDLLGDLAHGGPDSADLRQTLHTLLDLNCNVAETARALHFHYNTLRYRIGKLEARLGAFMTDPELRLSLALALRIVELQVLR